MSPEPANLPLPHRHYVVRGPEMTPYEGESAWRWQSGRPHRLPSVRACGVQRA